MNVHSVETMFLVIYDIYLAQKSTGGYCNCHNNSQLLERNFALIWVCWWQNNKCTSYRLLYCYVLIKKY